MDIEMLDDSAYNAIPEKNTKLLGHDSLDGISPDFH